MKTQSTDYRTLSICPACAGTGATDAATVPTRCPLCRDAPATNISGHRLLARETAEIYCLELMAKWSDDDYYDYVPGVD